MNKIGLLLLFIGVSLSSFCQISGTKAVRIANATTIFSEPLSEGNILIDLDTDKTYLILQGAAGTESLSSLTVNVDYSEIANTGGDGWGSDVVVSDSTLSGDGTSGNLLKVDTTVIATKNDLTGGLNDAAFNNVSIDTLNVATLNYPDTYWDDLQVNIASAKLKPTAEPLWIGYNGGYVLSFENGSTEELYFTAQLSHKYKHGSDISFHLHLIYPDGNSGDVDWTFTYSWANINEDFPTASSETVQTASPVNQDSHTIGPIADLTGTEKQGSSVLICSLKRNGSDIADTYGNSVYLVSLDFHYQIDKPGSNNVIPD
ncbi:MAG: hypothetical protein JW833_14615 [Prolixibacteraceae bacterium]|nr:hypothetical protein [Prolixibacteraceae bacterium]